MARAASPAGADAGRGGRGGLMEKLVIVPTYNEHDNIDPLL